MAGASSMAVYSSMAANLLVAAAKFIAAALSGSGAMLTEAVHSTTDNINQILLLYGQHRSRKPADEAHPFGYGGEAYFWVFLVAVAVALSGGAISIAKGVLAVLHPEPIKGPWINVAVFLLSAVFEGGSLVATRRAAKQQAEGRPLPDLSIGLMAFVKRTKDPGLFETLLEDVAALVGLAVALVGTALSAALHWLWADGVASIGVGLVLLVQSFLIARSTRSLISNEAADPLMVKAIRDRLAAEGVVCPDDGVRTLQVGPNMVIAMIDASFPGAEADGSLAERTRRAAARVRDVDDMVKHVYFNLSDPPEAAAPP